MEVSIMSLNPAIAAPLSRKDIRKMVKRIREIIGLESQICFPILYFLENIMPEIDSEFHIEILPKEEMGECFGLTYPKEHKIILREDVYEGAANGQGMHRFTVAHEVAHYFLHKNGSVVLARTKGKLPAYMDPEWQADCFAGELLMPAHLIRGMNYKEVSLACQVSISAAQTQLSKL
jgi:hypothetical protein